MKTWHNSEIEALANNLNRKYMERFKNDDSLFLDVPDLVRRLGGRIEYVPFIGINSNTMKVDSATNKGPDGKWQNIGFNIRVANTDSRRRQKFTLAHELGHLFMHFLNDSGERREFARISYAEGGKIEQEANYFAGALLMPKDKYEEQYKKYSGDLAKVSDAFDVSITAAEVRAKVLKLR